MSATEALLPKDNYVNLFYAGFELAAFGIVAGCGAIWLSLTAASRSEYINKKSPDGKLAHRFHIAASGVGMFAALVGPLIIFFAVGWNRLSPAGGAVLVSLFWIWCWAHIFRVQKKLKEEEHFVEPSVDSDSGVEYCAVPLQTARSSSSNGAASSSSSSSGTISRSAARPLSPMEPSALSSLDSESETHGSACKCFSCFPYHKDQYGTRRIDWPTLKESLITYYSVYFAALWKGIRRHRVLFALLCVLSIVAATLVSLAFVDVCFCVHPNEFTTKWSRSLQPISCPSGAICHTYLTLPEDPSTSMILQFHTADMPSGSPFASISTTPGGGGVTVTGTTLYMSNVKEVTRWVHTVEFTSLSPNTTYYFTAGIHRADMAGVDILSNPMKFSTLHNSPSAPIKFIAGGDIQQGPVSESLIRTGSAISPSFISVGGDIAYENGFATCYRRWDEWLASYQRTAVDPQGRMIPMVLAIGNHEAGGFVQAIWGVQFYNRYFSFRLGEAVLDPNSKPMYHSHKIGGHSLFVALDSGVVTKHQDQVPYLTSLLSDPLNANRTVRMTTYHAPLYPSVRTFSTAPSALGRQYWGPLFSAYNVSVSFENHDHYYKRTHPIRDNQIASSPPYTVFMGDGCMGVGGRSVAGTLWYAAYTSPNNFVNHVTVSNAQISVNSLDENGVIFDSYSRNF